MAIKFKITKAVYEGLSDEMKGNYIAGDNEGEFVADVSGLPAPEDVGPIKRALEVERGKNKTMKGEKDALQAQLDAAPDVEKIKADYEKQVGKYKTFTEKTLLDNTASTMAAKISTVPSLIAKEIKSRLEVDLSGDEPTVKIKGADGKVSPDMTLEKLQQEIVANKEFATIIIASKATGGGAPKPGIKPFGGGAPKAGENGEEPKPFDAANANPQDFAARIAARKAAETEAANAT